MRKNWLLTLYAATALAAIAVMFAVGCGGGGGTVNSSSSTAFAALLPPAQHGATIVGNVACAKCHAAEANTYSQTIHNGNRVTCESCHGPGSIHAANPQTTNILTYPNITESVVCAQCHVGQNQEWSGSPHGQPVADVVTIVQSAPIEAETCFRCHSDAFHDQLEDHPTSVGETPTQINAAIESLTSAQLTVLANNVHASASCSNCHDPHQNTSNVPTFGPLAGTQLMLRRQTANLSSTGIDAGATLTDYPLYNQECGSCHNTRGADPTNNPMTGLAKETSRPPVHEGPEMNMLLGISGVVGPSGAPSQGSHYLAADQCIHCHMPNGSHTFTVNLDTSCVPCHSSADAAAREQAVQTTVLNDLVGLQSRLQGWAVATYGADNTDSWDYTTNIPSGQKVPKQSTVPIQVQQARYNYYYVIMDRSNGVHNAPYAEYLLSYANQVLNEVNAPPAAVRGPMSIRQMKAIIEPYIARTNTTMALEDSAERN